MCILELQAYIIMKFISLILWLIRKSIDFGVFAHETTGIFVVAADEKSHRYAWDWVYSTNFVSNLIRSQDLEIHHD